MSARTEPARVVPWTAVAGWCLLGAAPVVVALARNVADLTIPTTAAALVLGAAAGTGLDDPAHATVAAVPVPLSERRLVRLGWVLVAVAATALVLATAIAARDARVEATALHLAALAVATGATSVAIAGRTSPDVAHGTPGVAGSGGALLCVVTLSALAQRVDWLPNPADSGHTGRWWLVAAAASLAALGSFRDPAARTRTAPWR